MDKLEQKTIDFVASKLGQDAAIKLKNMHMGGLNNYKGNYYEILVTSIKATEFAASHAPKELHNIIFTAQEMGFVDDLTIYDITNNIKLNYQIKNSSGNTAKWSKKHSANFSNQSKIDEILHGYKQNQQIIICSDKKTFEYNRFQLNKEKAKNFYAEYIPCSQDILELIEYTPNLRKALNQISVNSNLATINYVFTVIGSVINSTNLTTKQYLSDIIIKAKYISKPDYFIDELPANHPPDWLIELCEHIKGLKIYLEKGLVILEIRQLKISLGKNPTKPVNLDKIVKQGKISITNIISLLMANNHTYQNQTRFTGDANDK